MIIKGILFGIAAFLAVAMARPTANGAGDYVGILVAGVVGVLVAVAVALPD